MEVEKEGIVDQMLGQIAISNVTSPCNLASAIIDRRRAFLMQRKCCTKWKAALVLNTGSSARQSEQMMLMQDSHLQYAQARSFALKCFFFNHPSTMVASQQ